VQTYLLAGRISKTHLFGTEKIRMGMRICIAFEQSVASQSADRRC